jgi:hypothetical protein
MERTFYRAVSFAELADFRSVGRLRACPASCEGKHLACTLVDARRWGELLCGAGSFAVLRVVASDDVVAKWASWARLDGIGPAHFATIEELEGVHVDEVIDEP